MTNQMLSLFGSRSRFFGFSLLEFLIALLVFSIGLMGFSASSLTARKTTFESAQYSLATMFAVDMLQRIRSNSGQSSEYLSQGAQWLGELPGEPAVNCQSHNCSAAELAEFDLWQWKNGLLGANAEESDDPVPVLPDVRACLSEAAGTVTIVLNWLGSTRHRQLAEDDCGPPAEHGNVNTSRRQVSLSTYIAAPL